jgi:hypothetical protein
MSEIQSIRLNLECEPPKQYETVFSLSKKGPDLQDYH